MELTLKQFDDILSICKDVFYHKMKDYGSAWRILRPSSLTDQIYIKAQRIRSIDTKGKAKVNEGIKPEFIGIINYSIMALVQIEKADNANLSISMDEALNLYEKYAAEAKELLENKNHDYGEAWRNMRVSSLTDIILMKLMRIKQIEDNAGKTFASEGVEANYFDIINYAVFAMIKLNFE